MRDCGVYVMRYTLSTMSGMSQRVSYQLAPDVPEQVRSNLADMPPLTQRLLAARGIIDTDTATAFLNPDYASLHDPFAMAGMERAVARILSAMERKERIVIYSDYDCDGIPGGVLLHDFFAHAGYMHAQNYIPHRHHEGYGLNVDAIEQLHASGAQLIVTVDCGITDCDPASRAAELGIDVIITDHHEPGPTLPDAHAVLNPKLDTSYPFQGLCGSGVAFKLVQALLARGDFDIKPGWEKWWLDVVGIATIADMVPLTGENRILAHYGLKVLRKTRRPGLQQLLRTARIDPATLTEDDIGFVIGPRINAASRMDTPEDAFHMLAARDEESAGTRVRHLERLNNERKGVVAAMVKDIKKRTAQLSEMRPVLVMGNPSWRPALVGLAANTLAETYRRPVFLWGRDGRDVIKGSCRSGGAASVVTLMREVADTFIEYGGHHESGGFSVRDTQIHSLEAALNDAYLRLDRADAPAPVRMVDAVLSLDDVTPALIRELAALAPFGEGNPKPLFAFRDIAPLQVEMFGKGKEHLKALLPARNGSLEAIAFFVDREAFGAPLAVGEPITMLAHVEQSFFMRRPRIRLRIVDVLPQGSDLC